MFNIKNKIRIISAVILAISTAATVLSSCGESTPEIPVETVIGTDGEILGVSVYTEENASETQTVLYEITTKKKFSFGIKNNKTDDNTTAETENNVSDGLTEIKIISSPEKESTSRVRATFPQKNTEKTTHVASSFAENNGQATKHVPVSYVPKNDAPKTTKKAVPSTAKQTQAINSTTKKTVSDEIIKEEAEGINIVMKNESVEKGNTASVMIQGEPGKKYSIVFYTSPTETANLSSLEDKTADENGFVTWTFSVPMSCESGNRKIVIKENGTDKYAQTSINVK